MDVGTVISVGETLNAALQSSELREFLSKFGYESELEDLQYTVSTINVALRDVEVHGELNYEAQEWIWKLKDPIFEANDMLDKFVILAEQKQLVQARGSLAKQLSHFCSCLNNPSSVAYRISRGLKDIKKKLEVIGSDTERFDLKNYSDTVKQRRYNPRRFHHYKSKDEIVGREDDLENVVGTLVASNDQRAVSSLTIVGIEGLGKTTLARLVYDDPRVTNTFPLRLWIWVNDQDKKELDVEDTYVTITRQDQEGPFVKLVQSQVRAELAANKFLLVLDAVWSEDPKQCRELVKYFIGGEMGSWIVVTTCSQKTATNIGGSMYELQGLSEDDSWRLFAREAFWDYQSDPPHELVNIGREIIKGCAGVPLALLTLGRRLSDPSKRNWQFFKEKGSEPNSMIPILKQSLNNLDTPLRTCFNYFAIFPNEFQIDKQMLLSLWMAQGYVVPLDEAQSIEEAAEEYFFILLRRCIFQDIKKDKFGEILSCRLNLLMHDVARRVTENEIYIANTISGNRLNSRVRHVSLLRGGEYSNYSLGKTNIYSFLHVGFNGFRVGKVEKSVVESLIENSRCLRALDLTGLVMESLPESIGKLFHLRYLNLSQNTELAVLPESIAELINLQTLELSRCDALRVLPKDLRRLVNLMKLDIRSCSSLTCMSRGMGDLTSLHGLSDFIVGGQGSYSSWNRWFGGVEDLKTLGNLKGRLNIQIRWPDNDLRVVKEDGGRKESHMSSNNLSAIVFHFRHEESRGRVDNEGGRKVDNEGAVSLMEEMQPHPSLKYLEVKKYHGARMPGWITLLTNLVELHFANCGELEYLPCLGNLHHLKVLKLIMLANLEYIGEDSPSASSNPMHMPGLVSSEGLSYYPSLETLELSNLPKLKGWRRGVGDDQHHHQVLHDGSSKAHMQLRPCFSQLKSLFVWNCPEMSCIPACPMVEDLKLIDFNKRLRLIDSTERGEQLGEEVASSSTYCNDTDNLKSWSSREGYIQHGMANIKKVAISNVAWLDSLPVEALQHIESLSIWCDKEVESLGEVERVLHSCSSSLRFLIIHNCRNLRAVVSGGLEHLTALEELQLRNCHNLMMSEEEKEGDESIDIGTIPWSSLHHSLCTLTLQGLPQLVNLPNWIQFLPSLESINISFCNRLKSMPAWMPKLACLRKLKVHGCSAKLNRRCQQDLPGEDWPFIQHIPHISISASRF